MVERAIRTLKEALIKDSALEWADAILLLPDVLRSERSQIRRHGSDAERSLRRPSKSSEGSENHAAQCEARSRTTSWRSSSGEGETYRSRTSYRLTETAWTERIS